MRERGPGVGTGAAILAALALSLSAIAAPALGQQRGNRGDARHVFNSQTTDGETLVVDHYNSTEGGFIVAYEEAFLEGVIFPSLRGSTDYLPPGPGRNATIHLDEPLERDRTIVAVFHKDTNDNRELDVEETEGREDGPYQGATGAVFNVADVTVEENDAIPAPGGTGALLAAGIGALAAARRRGATPPGDAGGGPR